MTGRGVEHSGGPAKSGGGERGWESVPREDLIRNLRLTLDLGNAEASIKRLLGVVHNYYQL